MNNPAFKTGPARYRELKDRVNGGIPLRRTKLYTRQAEFQIQGSCVKDAIKSFLRGPVGSWLISVYLRLVSLTSRHIRETPAKAAADHDGPVIYATWHGQNFVFAFHFSKGRHPTLLVAHHGDGRMIGQAMAYMGVPLVFGSGTTDETDSNKGGARAALQLLKVLRTGKSITLTADVPKIALQSGAGVILLARKSGAPIVPVAMTTSRRRILKTWDQMQLNLPFSRMAFVEGEPIYVPSDSKDPAPYQAALDAALNAVQARAFELVTKQG